MDLEKLQEASKDLKIDDTELDMESVRTPIIHAKYLKYQSKFSLLLKKAEDDYDVLAKENGSIINMTESVYKENHLTSKY